MSQWEVVILQISLTVISVVIWMLGVVSPHVECVAPPDLRNIIWDICTELCGTQASSQGPEVKGKEGLFPLKSGSRWASCNKMASGGGGNKKKSTLPHAIYGKPCTHWHKQHAPAFCCACGWSRSWVPHAWNSLLLFSATLREKDCFPAMPAAWRAMLLWVCIGLPVQALGALVIAGGGAPTQVRSPFEINCDLDGLFSVCMQNRLAK